MDTNSLTKLIYYSNDIKRIDNVVNSNFNPKFAQMFISEQYCCREMFN